MNNTELSLLVISCDKYADVWNPFFKLFWRYWPDCPYPIYLGANQRTFDDPRIEMILTGKDYGWASSTIRMMKSINSEYVLVLLEDFLIYRAVDLREVDSLLEALVNENGAYLRLMPSSPPDRDDPSHENLGVIDPGSKYRVSLQAAIWNKDIFLQLLEPGESAWQMETRGTLRSEQIDKKFYSVWKPALHYQNAVVHREWVPSAVRMLKDEGITPDFTYRPEMSMSTILRLKRARLFRGLAALVPRKIRRFIGNLLRTLGLLPPRIE